MTVRLRESASLSAYEKALIRSDYAAVCRGDHETSVAIVASKHKVTDACVRLLVFERQMEIQVGRL